MKSEVKTDAALPPKFRSIRARMTAFFALFIAFLMVLMCVAFYFYSEHQESRRVAMTLQSGLDELSVELHHRAPSVEQLRQLVTEESDEMRVLNVAILVADNSANNNRKTVVAASRIPAKWPPPADWRYATMQRGNYTFAVALPWGIMMARLRQQTNNLALMGILVVVLSSLGAWSLVGRTLSPLGGLAQQANAASAENLRVQLQSPSNDAEMEGLVATLNDLLARLAQTSAARGRFYAAASHELRTPLQGLAGALEVALSRPRSGEEYVAVLEESRGQTERLTRLTQDLLLLNQLEVGTTQPEALLIDWGDICERELCQLRPLAAQRGLRIGADLPLGCEQIAPWTHATMLLRNLLENAVKYSVPGGLVSVKVGPRGLQIWNQSEGAPAAIGASSEACSRWFEPFFRPDAARQSQTGGNGLGLAICKAICDANGWKISLERHEIDARQGVRARVEFGG